VIQPKQNYYGSGNNYINPLAINFPNVHSGGDATKCIVGGLPTAVVINWPVITVPTGASDDNVFSGCTFMWRRGANDYLFTQISYSDIDNPIVGQTLLLLYPALGGFPAPNDRYNIYYNLPYTMGSLQAGSSANKLVLSASPYFSNPNTNEINNMWLMITDTEDTSPSTIPSSILGQCYKIVSYDATTKIATVDPPLAVAPAAGIAYEIYKPYKEGVGSLWFSGGIKDQFATRCRNVTLTGLTLPNAYLDNRSGGRIDRYPYIIVRISNDGHSTTNNATMATNSDVEHDATFIVPIYITLSNQRFFTISTNVTKKLQLDFNRPIRVTIKNPDGDIIKFASDNAWVSTFVPWFSSHIPPNLATFPAVEAVRYPGYTPETPPPICPAQNQITLIMMVDCSGE
jgi:hypothetical protein